MEKGRRLVLGSAVLAAVTLALLTACGDLSNSNQDDVAPNVVGSPLLEADGILVAWCENVRVVIDPVVPIDQLDPSQVQVRAQRTTSVDPAAPPPPGTLRVGWALDPPPSSSAPVETSTAAATTTEPVALPTPTASDSPSTAAGIRGRALTEPLVAEETDDAVEPPDTEFCRTGRVPTVTLSLEAEVPDLSGVPVGEAIDLLTERGIPVDASDTYEPAALVESQSVPAGTLFALGSGSTMEVTPGDVPEQVVLLDVPDVQHLAVNAGCAIIRSEGFECSVLTVTGELQYESDWQIVSQYPRVPTRAAEGATVKVVVTGPSVAVVPVVVDLPYGTACEILRDSHLICRASGDLGKREVSAQLPEPGASVEPNSVVTLEFTQVPWYESWNGRLVLLFIGGVLTGLGGLTVRALFGGRRRRARTSASPQ